MKNSSTTIAKHGVFEKNLQKHMVEKGVEKTSNIGAQKEPKIIQNGATIDLKRDGKTTSRFNCFVLAHWVPKREPKGSSKETKGSPKRCQGPQNGSRWRLQRRPKWTNVFLKIAKKNNQCAKPIRPSDRSCGIPLYKSGQFPCHYIDVIAIERRRQHIGLTTAPTPQCRTRRPHH